ncbi:MbcA/ParS/Xre antitoxin family protein [Shinella daejeonensis]|uniref:MbcA/ParS/Xre antitoxin family protein n=1 Tax=Shinella daejeonensis TaxID=659017 RepID=UPI0020C74929|nr:MbcA/ParS/Xre antitoxin family protein [Shinella daejeonensis]MCP8897080.1 MbcA/ParS/Xre antitoxin family protein [Shinella daejeonensis]
MLHNPVTEAGSEGLVITKAAVNAAERLGLTARILAGVIGVSEATVSRLKRRDVLLERGTKPFELAVLLVRLFRSLDAITGGDEPVARRWMTAENNVLGGRPVDRILSISGLIDVIAYLDARRALV